MKRSRVAIVNDVRLAVEALRGIIARDPQLEVCWTALDGIEACERCAVDPPDIVLMDLVMPRMNGVEATRRIMQASPCLILVVTSTVQGHVDLVYEAMGNGALDAVVTPTVGGRDSEREAAELLRKIDTVLALGRGQVRRAASPVKAGTGVLPPLVAIGSSTGGPAAIETILRELPENFPAAVVVVQHIDHAFVPGLVTWLAGRTRLPLTMARSGERLRAGTVLIADSLQHLRLLRDGWLAYVDGPAGSLYCPSVDVFFGSAAEHARPDSTGVLLTGMGCDGASGLLSMRRAGLCTVIQNRATSVVYGMPGAAAEIGAAQNELPISEIAGFLIRQYCYGALQ